MIFSKKNKTNTISSNKILEYLSYKKRVSSDNILCHAPFSTLRFSLSGNIYVCCFNRLQLLGKYPENKLIDVWNSEKITQIRNSIKNNDLGMGCGYCSEEIKTGNFRSVGAYNYNYLKLPDNNLPTMLDFELGNNCNLECIMCNGENSALIRQRREHQLPYPIIYDSNFVKQLEPFIQNLSEARFVGGEPFLIDINYQIWEKIIELNPKCKITILTNGTILNEKIKLLLSKGNFNISVSADGISKNTYEKIRINADYDIFMKNLTFFHKLSKQNKSAFFWNFCPMKENWHEIPELFSFCNRERINIVFHTVVFPPQMAVWNISCNELENIKSEIIKRKPKFNNLITVHKQNNDIYNSFIKQLENWISSKKNIDKSSNFDSQELINRFYIKIKTYMSESKVFTSSQGIELFETYKTKLDNIFNQIDNDSLNKVLIYMLSINIDLIIAEIANNTDEKLKQKIITLSN